MENLITNGDFADRKFLPWDNANTFAPQFKASENNGWSLLMPIRTFMQQNLKSPAASEPVKLAGRFTARIDAPAHQGTTIQINVSATSASLPPVYETFFFRDLTDQWSTYEFHSTLTFPSQYEKWNILIFNTQNAPTQLAPVLMTNIELEAVEP